MSDLQPPAKRRRTQFSVAEKRQIVTYKDQHPTFSQDKIAAHFAKEWGKDVARSTISDILRQKSKWSSAPIDSDNVMRHRFGKHVDLEKALFLWFSDVRSQNACVTDQMLTEKAKYFGEQLKVDNFSYSSGWLQKFKKRHNISHHIAHGEAESANMSVVSEGRQQLQKDLENYDLSDIYNLDETGLFYRLGPNATLSTKSVRGHKKQKDRLTVTLCANANGTDKLTPLVIGKSARPRCFGKTFDPSVYVDYKCNKKAWMTTIVFQDWIETFNKRMRLKRRNVILLVDNASSHSVKGLALSNVTVKFLPPNTTSHIQPMDAGIIANFKVFYKKFLVKHFLDCIEDKVAQTISVRQAITFIKEAWGSVKPSTIVNCWRHVKILPVNEFPSFVDEDEMTLRELQQLLQHMPSEDRMDAAEYVAIDNSIETGKRLSDDSIMELVTDSRGTEATFSDSDNDSDDEPDELITRHNAKMYMFGVIRYFEQNPAIGRDHLDNLWKAMRSMSCNSVGHVQKSIMDFVQKQ